jgi:thioredoxin reductase (NADPH)
VKYWINPDISNRLKNGEIRAMFRTVIEEIRRENLVVRNTNTHETSEIAADFVVLHTGYRPDITLLEQCGVEFDKRTLVPAINPETYETTAAGIYVAGSVMCGCESYNIFIENGRLHARPIIDSIAAKYL